MSTKTTNKKEKTLEQLIEYCHSRPIYKFEDVKTSPNTIRYINEEHKFGIVMKDTVLNEHPNILKYSMNDIASKEVHKNYIHNTAGPAIFHTDAPKGQIPYMEIWTDGVPVFDKEEFYNRAFDMFAVDRLEAALDAHYNDQNNT